MALLGKLSTASRVYSATFAGSSPVTGSAPTDITDGLPTWGLSQVTVLASVASGVTLSGVNVWQCFEMSGVLRRWVRNPSQDFSLSTSGVRDLELGVVQVAQFKQGPDEDRCIWVPVGVTFSAGSAGVTITLVGTYRTNASTGQGG